MQEWESTLCRIQELDLEIAVWQGQLDGLPARIDAIKQRFAALKEKLEAAQKDVQDAQLAIKRTEGEITDLGARKKDFQTKSSLIRNNDEYKAALIQMELCDKTVSDLEVKLIELMDAREAAEKALEQINSVIADAKVEANAELDEMGKTRCECQENIARNQASRAELAAGMPADVMSRYERLRNAPNNRSDQPVYVSISGGNCGKCKMKLTAQTVADVRKGSLAFCTFCGAILHEDWNA